MSILHEKGWVEMEDLIQEAMKSVSPETALKSSDRRRGGSVGEQVASGKRCVISSSISDLLTRQGLIERDGNGRVRACGCRCPVCAKPVQRGAECGLCGCVNREVIFKEG
jgi:hypothetical protein